MPNCDRAKPEIHPLPTLHYAVDRTPEEGTVRSSNCEMWSANGNHPVHPGGFKFGGFLNGYFFHRDYSYSGFAYSGSYEFSQGPAYADVRDFRYHIENVTFYGYSGVDSCGRKNIAINNEHSGHGEGSNYAFASAFGTATCYPVQVKNVNFSHTPTYARLRFSVGSSSRAARRTPRRRCRARRCTRT